MEISNKIYRNFEYNLRTFLVKFVKTLNKMYENFLKFMEILSKIYGHFK